MTDCKRKDQGTKKTAKEEEDEKINDCFNGFVQYEYFSMCPVSAGQGGGMMVVGCGDELRMVFYGPRFLLFWFRLYDETKVTI